jgi:hypothetical protein
VDAIDPLLVSITGTLNDLVPGLLEALDGLLGGITGPIGDLLGGLLGGLGLRK